MSKQTDKAAKGTETKSETPANSENTGENASASSDPNADGQANSSEGNPSTEPNESSAASTDSVASAPPADGDPASADAGVALETEEAPGVSVVLLPARLRNQQLTLEYPFHINKQAHQVIVAGKLHVLQDLAYNPHTLRTEGLLESYTFTDQAELDQFLAAGWTEA